MYNRHPLKSYVRSVSTDDINKYMSPGVSYIMITNTVHDGLFGGGEGVH